MSTLEADKHTTEKFIENAVNEDKPEAFPKNDIKESEKLILDAITNEKTKKLDEIKPIQDTDGEANSHLQNIIESQEVAAENDLGNKSGVADSEIKNPSEEHPEVLQENEESTIPDQPAALVDEWQDILGSGVIMKKMLKEGTPETRPSRSEKCFINFTCRLDGDNEDKLVDNEDNFEIGLGEGDVVQGLDVAIGLMNKNERCLLKIGSRLAFGERGLPPQIPGDATVVYDVELVDVQSEDDCYKLGVKEKQKIGNKKRERGNWWYQRGDNTLAVQCYRRALDFLDEVENDTVNPQEKPSDSELQELLEDRLKVLNNMASAQIKMELFDQALISLQTVLRCQPDNVKALFRKAKIHTAKNDLPQAIKLLEKARSLEPEDGLIAKEINIVNGLIQKQKNSEREYARRMFGGSSGSNSKLHTSGKGARKGRSARNSFQLWATLGATFFVGLAGVLAYKFKYP